MTWSSGNSTMEKNALCISLLSGYFKAAVLQRGSVVNTFERAEPLEDLLAFPSLLTEAVEHSKSQAKRAVMVVAHARLSTQIVEVPPAESAMLDRYLERRVKGLKSFEGDAAWSRQPAMRNKNSEAVLLHLLPRNVLDQLAAGCESSGMQLVRVIPTTSVLANQLSKLPLAEGEIALLAAETGRTTSVVIGTRDGRVCLARVLPNTWNRKADSVAMDLDRTIGFINQESGVVVNSVWLFGVGAEVQAPKLASSLSLPVKISPVPVTPFYWAEQAATLSEANDGNLVSLEARQAPQRRRLLAVIMALTVMFCLASLAVTCWFEYVRRQNLGTLARTSVETRRLEARIYQAEQREAELKRKRGFSEFVEGETLRPVPGWFLGYVGEVVPEEFLLTQLRVAHTNNQWQMKMHGTLQPASDRSRPDALRARFASLTNALVNGPFRVKLTRSFLNDPLMDSSQGAAGQTRKPVQFEIEGVMQ